LRAAGVPSPAHSHLPPENAHARRLVPRAAPGAVLREDLAALGALHQRVGRWEAIAVGRGEFTGAGDEAGQATVILSAHTMMRPEKPALRYLKATATWAQLSRRSLQSAAASPTGACGRVTRGGPCSP